MFGQTIIVVKIFQKLFALKTFYWALFHDI